MKYIILTEAQANSLTGTKIENNVLMPVKILSGEYTGSFACSEACENDFKQAFASIAQLTKVELNNVVFQKDPVNRNLTGLGVEIPAEYHFVFDGDKFVLNEFEIPLTTKNEKKYVDISYFNWKEFRAELDTKDERGEFKYKSLKRALMQLWDYVALQAANNNFVQL